MSPTVFERISQLSSRRWWLSQRRKYLEFIILLTIVRVWFRRHSWMSPSDSNLHRDVPPPPPPPPPCPQAAGDPHVRLLALDVDGTRRQRDSGDDSTSGVDGDDDDAEECDDTAPFNGICSSLSCRRISSVATPPHPPLSLEPSAEILPTSSSTASFGVSVTDPFSTSILNGRVERTSSVKRLESVARTTTAVCKRTVTHNS